MFARRRLAYQPHRYLIKNLNDRIITQDDRGRIKFRGLDATKVIQDTFNALDPGDSCLIRRATYDVAPLTLAKTQTIVRGEPGATLRLKDNQNDNVLNVTADFCNVEGLTIDGNRENQTKGDGIEITGKHCRVLLCHIKSCRTYGVDMYGVYGWVQDTEVEDIGSTGINIRGMDSVVSRVVLKPPIGGYGVAVRGNGSYVLDSFLQYGTYGCYVAADIVTVKGCHFDGAPKGIYIGNNYYNIIIANTLYFASGTGITIDYGDHNVIANNLICNSGTTGSPAEGILLKNHANYNLIIGNMILDTAYGTYAQNYGVRIIDTASYNNIIDNVLRNNRSKDVQIAVSTAVENRIEDNYLETLEDLGTDTIRRRNRPYLTENSGTATFSGDGVTADFLIGSHGMAEDPTDPSRIYVKVTPASGDAVDASPCVAYASDEDADGAYESIRVKFSSPPVAGTNNVVVRWRAELH